MQLQLRVALVMNDRLYVNGSLRNEGKINVNARLGLSLRDTYCPDAVMGLKEEVVCGISSLICEYVCGLLWHLSKWGKGVMCV